MINRTKGFSMSEMLVTLGLIGVLAITMISMNNFAGYNTTVARTNLAQVDNALQAWGKAVTSSNETGLGASVAISNQGQLESSIADYFNNRGSETGAEIVTTNSSSETLNGATKFTLDNGVELSVKYLGTNSRNITVGGKAATNAEENIAYVKAKIETKNTPYSEEYLLTSNGFTDLDSRFEGWAKYEVIRTTIDDGHGGTTSVVGYCSTAGCEPGGDGWNQLNDDFEGDYVYTNTKEAQPCPSGQNGSILAMQIGSVSGTYDFEDNQCCSAPQVRKNGKCSCPSAAEIAIKAGFGYDSTDATCQRKCTTGEYSNGTNCVLCTEGHYCSQDGLTSAYECPAGHYCPNYAQNEKDNEYNSLVYADKDHLKDGGLINDKACQPGFYQPEKNQTECKVCDIGYYCPNSGMTEQIPCPAGTYFDAEMLVTDPDKANTAEVCKPCPANTYNPNTAAKSIKECKPCPDGSWTEGDGATTCTTCPAGTLFDADQQKCVPCPVGYYCPDPGMKVGEEIACACGYYQPKTGQTECLVVPAGTYPTMGDTPKNDRTPAVQVTSGATHAQLCPKGYLCLGGCPSDNPPTKCSAGYYQPNLGKAECLPCECGYYQNETGAISCKTVAAGRYPAVGSTYAESAATNNPTCHAGKYCTGGCHNERACTSGFSYAGWASCHTCPTAVNGRFSVGTHDINEHTNCRCNGTGSWTISASDDYDVWISLSGTAKDDATGGSATFSCIGVIHYRDPIILDLKGDGIKLTTPENGVMFDLVGDGNPVQTAWTDVQTEFDDAFLARDLNNNGKIEDINELFGDTNGSKNGFQELAKYDDNKDGIVNKDDAKFGELLLWADMNKDGITDEGELKTLEELNITEIATTYKTEYDENGNIIVDEHENQVGMTSWFKQVFEKVVDGVTQLVEKIGKVFDVFFKTA